MLIQAKRMRVALLSLVILLFAVELKAKKLKGQIINQDDTIAVIFKIPVISFDEEVNFHGIQRKVKYLDSNGIRKVLRPEDAEEIRFVYAGEEIRMLSRNTIPAMQSGKKNSKVFLRLEVDGKAKLFNYYPQSFFVSAITSSLFYNYEFFNFHYNNYLQKGNEELTPTGVWRKGSNVSKFFSDCPALVKKIAIEEFGRQDIDLMVEYYNTECP